MQEIMKSRGGARQAAGPRFRLEPIISALKARVVGYPLVAWEMLRGLFSVLLRIIRVILQVIDAFWCGIWTGNYLPLVSARVIVRGEDQGTLDGWPGVIGRLLAFLVVAVWESICSLVRRPWLAVGLVAVLWIRLLVWSEFLRGKIGEAAGFLAEALSIPAVGLVGAFLVVGFLRARLAGRTRLRAVFFRRLAREDQDEGAPPSH